MLAAVLIYQIEGNMSNFTKDENSPKENFDPLIMFPSSKNFPVEDESDPLEELLNEFSEYEEEDNIDYDEDRTYIKKIPELKNHKVEDFIHLMDKFDFYLSEVNQYWHE